MSHKPPSNVPCARHPAHGVHEPDSIQLAAVAAVSPSERSQYFPTARLGHGCLLTILAEIVASHLFRLLRLTTACEMTTCHAGGREEQRRLVACACHCKVSAVACARHISRGEGGR
jgi:hypothetical protein